MNSENNPPKKLIFALVAPLILFLMVANFEPKAGEEPLTNWTTYPMMYTFKALAVTFCAALCFPTWRRLFPLRVSRWTLVALGLGVFGAALWVGVCMLQKHFGLPGLAGTRSGYDPFRELEPYSLAMRFWAIRMVGLALVVPVIEEVFLRGFLLRFLEKRDWHTVAVGALSMTAWVGTLVYALATHPGEPYAAILWFPMVTWLVGRSKNLWDAVVLHATTNLLLGLYVVYSGAWWLM